MGPCEPGRGVPDHSNSPSGTRVSGVAGAEPVVATTAGEQDKGVIVPESVLPFKLDERRAPAPTAD